MARPPGHGPGYAARQEEIIDEAAALFARRGYGSVGTADLGAAVGLGKGALYHYIGSKENLLVEIQERVLTPLLTRTRRIVVLDADPLVRLRLLSETLLDVIFDRLDHIWVYEHEYRHLHGDNRRRLVGRRSEFEQLIQDLISAAIGLGRLRDVDPRLAALQFLNLHNHTYQWAHLAAGRWSVTTLSSEYCTTLFRGMAAGSVDLDELEAAVDAARPLIVDSVPGGSGAAS